MRIAFSARIAAHALIHHMGSAKAFGLASLTHLKMPVSRPMGALVAFWSDDRPALAEDGQTTRPQRWSTPIRDYRAMGPDKLASRGEGRCAAPDGEYAYIELEVHEVKTEIVPHDEGQQ